MAKLTPYLIAKDARAQAAFYTEALGGEIRSVVTGETVPDASEELKKRVMHLELVAAGITLHMTDCHFESFSYGDGISLSLEFATEAEARTAFDRLAVGGTVKHPLEKAFWGALFGQLQDRFGVHWMISNQVNG